MQISQSTKSWHLLGGSAGLSCEQPPALSVSVTEGKGNIEFVSRIQSHKVYFYNFQDLQKRMFNKQQLILICQKMKTQLWTIDYEMWRRMITPRYLNAARQHFLETLLKTFLVIMVASNPRAQILLVVVDCYNRSFNLKLRYIKYFDRK